MIAYGSRKMSNSREFHDVFLTHFDSLVTFLMARTDVGRHGAEDLAQEVMVRAWRSLPTLVGEVQDLTPWLRTVARHVAIDTNRARRARPEEILCEPGLGFSAEVTGADHNDQILDRVTVSRMLRRLNAHHRDVVELFYLRDMDVRGISVRLEIPVGTVKSRLYHALRLMRSQSEHERREPISV